jgi:hypothetical protein
MKIILVVLFAYVCLCIATHWNDYKHIKDWGPEENCVGVKSLKNITSGSENVGFGNAAKGKVAVDYLVKNPGSGIRNTRIGPKELND